MSSFGQFTSSFTLAQAPGPSHFAISLNIADFSCLVDFKLMEVWFYLVKTSAF